MNREWEKFLRSAGARIADGQVADFGNVAREKTASLETAALVDLGDLAFIRAAGTDAVAFLNGQLTNDLRPLDDSHHRLAAYCNPKGRVITLFRIWHDGADLLLQLPVSLAPGVIDRLRHYMLRAKVSLAHDETLIALGLIGPTAADVLAPLTGGSALLPGRTVRGGGAAILAIPGIVPRFIIVAQAAARQQWWERLSGKAACAGLPLWRWHDIRAGLPTVLPQTTEAFVPQMLNLDRLGGISFDKGCYPGQEIVARMHYLGRLKQRLYRLSMADNVTPSPGTEIFAPKFGEQAAGTVVDAVSLTAGRTDLLAVVQITSVDGDSLHLGSLKGPPLVVEPPPDRNTVVPAS